MMRSRRGGRGVVRFVTPSGETRALRLAARDAITAAAGTLAKASTVRMEARVRSS